MGRYGWLLAVGVILLGALGWVGVGKTLADDDTDLGPPVVVPSATAAQTHPTPTDEPTLDTSQRPPPQPSESPDGAGTTTGSGGSDGSHSSAKSRDASSDSHGADRIKPGPPRTAGDDDDDSDDDDDRDDRDDWDDDDDDWDDGDDDDD